MMRHYGMHDGTSMASAIVAGACASINSARIAAGKMVLGPVGMRDLLRATGADTTDGVPANRFLDVTKALQTACPDPDFDMDGKVSWADWWEFVSCWYAGDLRADFDGDGKVGWGDCAVLRARFGK
jgi:hypothetical protein